MTRRRVWGVALAVFWVLSAGMAAEAATLRVPSEYPTIQAGLDAAALGDTVLVAPGTYTDYEIRNVTGLANQTACAFLVDGVVLRSESGPQVTTIDLQGVVLPFANVIFGLFLASGETVVEGFTITGVPLGGSGVLLDLSARVTFRNCILRDMDAGSTGAGGGIQSIHTDLDVIGCEFENCRASTGGGIYQLDARIEVLDSSFRDCQSRAITLLRGGGSDPAQALISNCEFIGNVGSNTGGAVGINDYTMGAVITGCHFEGNVALGSGAGAVGIGGWGSKTIENSVFLFNHVENLAGIGGALWLGRSSSVVGNTFYGNSQVNQYSGGSSIVFAFGELNAELRNNVIAGSVGSPAVLAFNTLVMSSCNVFWDNAEGNGDGYVLGDTDQEVDPLFCDPVVGDVTLRADSPCLPENSGGCGLIGALGQGCGSVSVESKSWGSIKGAYR